jgi:hypothetical protein
MNEPIPIEEEIFFFFNFEDAINFNTNNVFFENKNFKKRDAFLSF